MVSLRQTFFAPIIADAEAGFGGNLNAFELMKRMIDAGVSGVHFEDQLASVKKCGHLGGKVLVPTQEAEQKLIAARLAADVSNTPTILIARTDADAADLVTSDIDDRDLPFLTGERTSEGFFRSKAFDLKKPSEVLSPVKNGRSLSSISEVTRSAASASVLAIKIVGVFDTSAASLAAINFCSAS